MPELPEVETTRRGIEPHLLGARLREIVLRRSDLRQAIPADIHQLSGQVFEHIERRSKYLILRLTGGHALLIHLGMSGSLRLCDPAEPWKTHDHVAFDLSTGGHLRYHDPRRFGLILPVSTHQLSDHPLLQHLGPEPLSEDFTPAHLAAAFAKRGSAVKIALMDARVVVGVGNIYASEALFQAAIHPATPANQVSLARVKKLVAAVKAVLEKSIQAGGTTLRDFLNADSSPGYFKQELFVYGRAGEPCRVCGQAIQQRMLGQRSTFWCPRCQRS